MREPNPQYHLERARLLLQQKRYRDAEQQAGLALKGDPNNAEALQVLGHCCLDTKRLPEAMQLFRQCIALDPDESYVYYLLAFAHYQQGETELALHFLEQAISRFPYHAGYFALRANLYLGQRKYPEALDAANEGLEVNAEDLSCLNARSKALFRLKDKTAAYESIQEALEIDPEDAYTHINYGWLYLEKGRHQQALEHFKQALRLQPNSQHAKMGLKNALKSKLLFYRWMLQYSLWARYQSRSLRIGIIIGLVLLVKLAIALQEAGGAALGYIAGALVGIYLLIILVSWLGNSLANLYLLCSRSGRYVLDSAEKWSAVLVGGSLLSAAGLLGWGLWLNQDWLLGAAGILASFSLLFSDLSFPLRLFRGGTKQWMRECLLALGLVTLCCLFAGFPFAVSLLTFYFPCFIGLMWLSSLAHT